MALSSPSKSSDKKRLDTLDWGTCSAKDTWLIVTEIRRVRGNESLPIANTGLFLQEHITEILKTLRENGMRKRTTLRQLYFILGIDLEQAEKQQTLREKMEIIEFNILLLLAQGTYGFAVVQSESLKALEKLSEYSKKQLTRTKEEKKEYAINILTGNTIRAFILGERSSEQYLLSLGASLVENSSNFDTLRTRLKNFHGESFSEDEIIEIYQKARNQAQKWILTFQEWELSAKLDRE